MVVTASCCPLQPPAQPQPCLLAKASCAAPLKNQKPRCWSQLPAPRAPHPARVTFCSVPSPGRGRPVCSQSCCGSWGGMYCWHWLELGQVRGVWPSLLAGLAVCSLRHASDRGGDAAHGHIALPGAGRVLGVWGKEEKPQPLLCGKPPTATLDAPEAFLCQSHQPHVGRGRRGRRSQPPRGATTSPCPNKPPLCLRRDAPHNGHPESSMRPVGLTVSPGAGDKALVSPHLQAAVVVAVCMSKSESWG